MDQPGPLASFGIVGQAAEAVEEFVERLRFVANLEPEPILKRKTIDP